MNGLPGTVDVGLLVLLNSGALYQSSPGATPTNDGFRIDFQPAVQAAITPLIGFGEPQNNLWHPSRYLEYPGTDKDAFQGNFNALVVGLNN